MPGVWHRTLPPAPERCTIADKSTGIEVMHFLTVFFDVGGTLQETAALFEGITKRLTGKESDKKTLELFSEMFLRLLQNTDAYRTIEDILANALTLFGREHLYADISNEAHDIYFNAFLHDAKLFKETIEVLDILHINNVKMIIASDNDVELMEDVLVRYDLSVLTGE